MSKAKKAPVLETSLRNAYAMHQKGDYKQASEIYRWILTQRPDHAQTLHLLGMAECSLGRVEEGVGHLRRASDAAQGDASFAIALGRVLARLERDDEAREAFERAVERSPQAAEPRLAFAEHLLARRKPDEAAAKFEEALERSPTNVPARVGLGMILERLGRRDEALAQARKALDLEPASASAHVLMARLERRAGDNDSAKKRMERALTGRMDGGVYGRACLELAFALDALGDHAQAFSYFQEGQRALYGQLDASARNQRSYYDAMRIYRASTTKEEVARWASPPEDGLESPVFLVGFPRSGTTLVEQMLISHPRFVSTDELPLLHGTKARIPSLVGGREDYASTLRALTTEHIGELRRVYWERARRAMGDALDGRRLVDKQPLNLIELPMVRLLFPDAKIVLTRRDPRDTCLSCFFQDFYRGMPHFFDLGATCAFFESAMLLLRQYRETLGLDILEVGYEDLVREPEAGARAILEFLGEPWNEGVLAFHETRRRRYVTTPSYEDVTRPVYTSSVGRWKNYAPALAPHMDRLRPVIEAQGYDA